MLMATYEYRRSDIWKKVPSLVKFLSLPQNTAISIHVSDGEKNLVSCVVQDFPKLIWPQNICLFLPSLHEIPGRLVWNILWGRLILDVIWTDFRKPDGLLVRWGCRRRWSSWRPPGWGVVCVSREGSQSQEPHTARKQGLVLRPQLILLDESSLWFPFLELTLHKIITTWSVLKA